MSEYIILGDTLTDIGDAIRAKTGGNSPLTPIQMPAEIAGIPTNISYTNRLLDSTVDKGTGGVIKTIDVAITGTAGKKHRLFAAKAGTASTSASNHTPVITEALTDVTDSGTVTSSIEGDTVTYTWKWLYSVTKSSSSTKYVKTASLLLLVEE